MEKRPAQTPIPSGIFTILFLPFILFESAVTGFARSLNLPEPPLFFSQKSTASFQLPKPPQFPRELPGPFSQSYENEEEWIWIDYKGQERRMTVRRHAQSR